MKGRANSEWDRLAGAAIAGRDELRLLAADLSTAMASGSIPRPLIIRARDTAQKHADALRMALKHPEVRERRTKPIQDLPCWSTASQQDEVQP